MLGNDGGDGEEKIMGLGKHRKDPGEGLNVSTTQEERERKKPLEP